MADESTDTNSTSPSPSASGEEGSIYLPSSPKITPGTALPLRTLRSQGPPSASIPTSAPNPASTTAAGPSSSSRSDASQEVVSSSASSTSRSASLSGSETSPSSVSEQDTESGASQESGSDSAASESGSASLPSSATDLSSVSEQSTESERPTSSEDEPGDGDEDGDQSKENSQNDSQNEGGQEDRGEEQAEEPNQDEVGGGISTASALAMINRARATGNVATTTGAGARIQLVESTGEAEQPKEHSRKDNREVQQHSNPHLNPNYPFDHDEPSDFVTGGVQQSNETTEKATSQESSSQEEERQQLVPSYNPYLEPNHPFYLGEPPKFLAEDQESKDQASNEATDRAREDGEEEINTPTTVSTELLVSPDLEPGSENGSESRGLHSLSDDGIIIEEEINTPTTVSTELLVWPESENGSEILDSNSLTNNGIIVEEEIDTPTTVSTELLVWPESENSSESLDSNSLSNDGIIGEEETDTPTTVSTELLVWPDIDPAPIQGSHQVQDSTIAPGAELTPLIPSTALSGLSMSSDVSPSTSEQDASRQGQENVKQALKENQMQLAKEELQGQDQVQKQQGQDEEDDEPVRGAKRKSRARSPSCEPQAKRQRTSRSRISKRQETTCRVAKRKATETHADPSKKLKTKQTKAKGKGKDVSSKSKRMNNAPTELLDVYVCGLNTDGQLGLGHSNDNAIHPTRNPHLSKKKAGVVQVAAGGAHCVALTYDNRILTWGANYEGQLGRRTRNLEDDEYPLVQSSTPNREETTPRDVDFSTTDLPEDTVFTQVAATDSATFVLTEFGDVYGWGTFRDNKSKLKEKTKRRVNADDSDYEDDDEGNCETVIGFSHANDLCQLTPTKIEGLKHITSLAAGAQHVLARHFRGSVYAWGAGSKDQLGRKQLKRAGSTHANLTPRVCIFPGNKCRSGFYGITGIGAGGHHSFAIKKNGEVYSWGWNMYGQTGIPEEESDSSDSYLESEATVAEPTLVPELQGEETISVTGGLKHSIAVTKDNRCLSWGAIRGSALGIPDKDINTNHVHSSEDGSVDEILEVPGLVTGIDGKVTSAAAGATHSLAIAGKRRAFGWGSNDEYEIGQQHKKEIGSASVIEGGELKDARVVAAVAGVQFTILLAQ